MLRKKLTNKKEGTYKETREGDRRSALLAYAHRHTLEKLMFILNSQILGELIKLLIFLF